MYKNTGVRPVVCVCQTSPVTRAESAVKKKLKKKKNLTTRCSIDEHWWRQSKLNNHLPTGKDGSMTLIELEWSFCQMNYGGKQFLQDSWARNKVPVSRCEALSKFYLCTAKLSKFSVKLFCCCKANETLWEEQDRAWLQDKCFDHDRDALQGCVWETTVFDSGHSLLTKTR